jgi:hypothetical protein
VTKPQRRESPLGPEATCNAVSPPRSATFTFAGGVCLRVWLPCLAAPQSTNPPLQPPPRAEQLRLRRGCASARAQPLLPGKGKRRRAPSPVAARKIRRGLGHSLPISLSPPTKFAPGRRRILNPAPLPKP